jgi:serine phosphatase RsbU (regulator of sigma subunit)
MQDSWSTFWRAMDPLWDFFPTASSPARTEILLEPGQIVVLLTDGITESVAPGGEEFGARGALDYEVAHHSESARQIADGLHLAA